MASENQLLPNIERSFILQALREGQRSDGRFLLEQRKVHTHSSASKLNSIVGASFLRHQWWHCGFSLDTRILLR